MTARLGGEATPSRTPTVTNTRAPTRTFTPTRTATFTPSIYCSFPCQLTLPSPEQYVTRLDSGLLHLIYSTYVTGSHGAGNQALAVDSAGNVYLTGTTTSADYSYAGGQTADPRPGTFLAPGRVVRDGLSGCESLL